MNLCGGLLSGCRVKKVPGTVPGPGSVFNLNNTLKEAEMGEEKKRKVNGKKVSRRGFLKGAAVAAGTAGLVGFPAVMRVSAQAPIKIR
jgi:hypothetical protein